MMKSEDDTIVGGAAYAPVPDSSPEAQPDDVSLEGESDEWPVRGPAKGIRLTLPTAAIVLVLLVAAGFWGGAVVEKSRRSSSGTAVAGFAARFRSTQTGSGTGSAGAGSFAAGGFPGFGGASSSAATGTVSVVDGKTLYILTASGSLVKVTLGASTTITRSAPTAADGLRPGDTVVVQGTTAKKTGNVTATSITATAPSTSASAAG
jgi:hypothetical protein